MSEDRALRRAAGGTYENVPTDRLIRIYEVLTAADLGPTARLVKAYLLVSECRLTAGELAAGLGLSPTTVYHHLGVLEAGGHITQGRDTRWEVKP